MIGGLEILFGNLIFEDSGSTPHEVSRSDPCLFALDYGPPETGDPVDVEEQQKENENHFEVGFVDLVCVHG